MKTIPDEYPNNLAQSLEIFENLKYQSFGFEVVFLDYDYTLRHWSMAFRNSVNFTNPDIRAETPLKAVHEMLDFLKGLK